MIEASPPEEATASHAIKLRALVAASLLVAILLLILQATPPFPASPAPPASSAPLLDAEPVIRVRISTLEPGQETTVSGFDSRRTGLRFVNKGGTLEIGGEPKELPWSAPQKSSEFGVGDRRYAGELSVVRDPSTSRIHLVNRLGIEQYLEGVVLNEMPPDSGDEALEAQAIASRSYAAFHAMKSKDRDWDVDNSERSQVYRGMPGQLALARRVVGATRGQVLTYSGHVLIGLFSSTCGGTTRSATEAFGNESDPPLRGVICGACDGTQFSSWSAKVKRTDAGRAIGLGGPVMEFAEVVNHPSGRLAKVDVRGEKTVKKLKGSELQDVFKPQARSSWFTKLEVSGDWILAEGRGFGHGVGMCQVGAARLASAGKTAEAILALYYPDAQIAWLYPVHDG